MRPLSRMVTASLSFCFLGIGLGASLMTELWESPSRAALRASNNRTAGVFDELKGELQLTRARMTLLEEELAAARKSGDVESASRAQSLAFSLLSMPLSLWQGVAAVGSSAIVSVPGEEDGLPFLGTLPKPSASAAKLSDAQVAERVEAARSSFGTALAGRDGAGAMAAMEQLAGLDKRSYPALVEMWQQMQKKKWLGLNKHQRRLWYRAEVFHWALSGENLGVDGKQALRFKGLALRYMNWYEPDREKQAETYVKLLGSLELPAEPDAKAKKQLRRGWERNLDLYRGTVRQLARVRGPEAGRLLGELAGNRKAPSDLRISALNGLANKGGREADFAIAEALRDPDPQVRHSAAMVKIRRAPPATGLLVTGTGRKSEARKLGIPAGAVMTSYGGRRVRNAKELQRMMRRSRGKTITVEVTRGGIITQYKVKGGRKLGLSAVPVRRRKP